jgi:hypothetical protein
MNPVSYLTMCSAGGMPSYIFPSLLMFTEATRIYQREIWRGYPYFLSAKGLVTSRAQSMKSCATGLRVRSFSVTTLVDEMELRVLLATLLIGRLEG